MKVHASPVPFALCLAAIVSVGPTQAAPPKSDSHASAAESGKSPKNGQEVPDEPDSDDTAEPSERDTDKSSGECRQSKAGLLLSIDKKQVNLEQGRVQAKMDGPICSLVMRLWRKDGDHRGKAVPLRRS